MSFFTRHVWVGTALLTVAACGIYALVFYPRGVNYNAQLAHAADRFRAYTLLDEGVTAQVKGDLALAREKYDAALAIDPKLYRAQYMKGELELAEGNLDEAIDRFNLSIPGLDSHADVLNSRGVARWRENDKRGALRDLNRALRLTPDFDRARTNRGLIRLLDGDRSAAQEDFTLSVESREKAAHAWRAVIGIGILHATEGRYQQALDNFSVAAQVEDERGLYGLYNRARVYEAMGDAAAAQRDREAYERLELAIKNADGGSAAAPAPTQTRKE
jgi:tetratricopeptide (TPR) repeat protein